MIFGYFKKFFYYFREEKRNFVIFSCLSILASLLELCGVALTYPFILKILSEQETTDWKTSPILIGALIILMFLLKNIFMVAFTWIQTKYTSNFEMKIKRRFVRFFLGAHYQVTSKISFAQKNKILGLLISNVMNNFIFRLLNLFVNFFIFCLITACLAIKFPIATLAAIIFGVLMLIVQTKIYKPYLEKMSKKISKSDLIFNQAYNDALLNIKPVKVSNNEKYFYDNFQQCMEMHYINCRKSRFVNGIPPFITEPFAIILLFIVVTVISAQTYTEPTKLVASLALVGAAMFRITPAISRIQVNLNGINTALPFVKDFLDMYEELNIKEVEDIKIKDFIQFNNCIEIKNLCFEYEKGIPVLKDINLKINKGEFIGIAGESGVGKTTLVDIIAGLYKATSGEILVDGNIMDKPLKIGYVPQDFVLINGDIRKNVAFGNSVIDDNKVIDVLKKAQLYDFIISKYKEGISANPFIDSTGFSQGQKQRLAIARALYSEPDVLILDEATSALDLKTEDEICKVLNELKGNVTILVIAHRLSTIKNADKILNLK